MSDYSNHHDISFWPNFKNGSPLPIETNGIKAFQGALESFCSPATLEPRAITLDENNPLVKLSPDRRWSFSQLALGF